MRFANNLTIEIAEKLLRTLKHSVKSLKIETFATTFQSSNSKQLRLD